jgi:hypothetical protein
LNAELRRGYLDATHAALPAGEDRLDVLALHAAQTAATALCSRQLAVVQTGDKQEMR